MICLCHHISFTSTCLQIQQKCYKNKCTMKCRRQLSIVIKQSTCTFRPLSRLYCVMLANADIGGWNWCRLVEPSADNNVYVPGVLVGDGTSPALKGPGQGIQTTQDDVPVHVPRADMRHNMQSMYMHYMYTATMRLKLKSTCRDKIVGAMNSFIARAHSNVVWLFSFV